MGSASLPPPRYGNYQNGGNKSEALRAGLRDCFFQLLMCTKKLENPHYRMYGISIFASFGKSSNFWR